MVLILWHSQYSSKMLRSVLFLSGCFKKLRDMFWYSSFISAILLLEMHLTLFDCTYMYNNLPEAKEIVNICWPPAKYYSYTSIQANRVGAVVRVLAFHQCVPGLIPALGVIYGLSLLVLYSALRGFSPGTPVIIIIWRSPCVIRRHTDTDKWNPLLFRRNAAGNSCKQSQHFFNANTLPLKQHLEFTQ